MLASRDWRSVSSTTATLCTCEASAGLMTPGGRSHRRHLPFFIGSNSKFFTALAVMQLAEAGKVDLDAPVQHYIPWFRVADPDASALITVRHLLNQTSGLTERAGRGATLAAGMHPLEPAVRALATTGLARSPGAAFEYSNLNYTTLGLVVEMAAGEPFDAYLKTHIFEPLNMHHTYTAIEDAQRDGLASGYRYWFGFPVAFDAPGHGGTVPAGGIISTAEDMSRYLAMYQGGGRYRGQVVLSPAGIDQMMQPGPPQKRGAFAGAGYGMGWFTGPWGGVDASYHPGDEPGAHAGMVLVPQGNWGVIVLFNVGIHGGALPGLLAIEQSVTGMVAGGTVTDTGIGALYAGFDAAVAVALAAEGWSLARLARRPGVEAQGRCRALPLLWEFGIPAAVAVMPTALFKVNWKGLFLYGPDMSCALGRNRRALRPHRTPPGNQNRTIGTQSAANTPDTCNDPAPVTTGRQRGASGYRAPAPRSTVTLCHCYGPVPCQTCTWALRWCFSRS